MKPALALAILLAFAAQGLRAEDLGTIQGQVHNVTGGGIPGVAIEVKSGLAEAHTATTDASGAFRITGLKYGAYGYTVTREGYSVHSISTSGAVQGPDPVLVDIQMAQPIEISGRVLDDSGQPAGHVCVQIHRRSDCEVYTDAAGAFRFPDLSTGVYTLVAKPQQDDRPTRTDGLALIATNYPSVVEREFAEPIVARPGAPLPEYEIRLRASRVYKLRGKVRDAAGKPVAAAKLRLLSTDPSLRELNSVMLGPAQPEEVLAISASADGSFEFTSVRPAEWLIEAELDPVNDPIERDLEPTGSVPVTVSSQDVEDIVIQLAEPFKLEYTEDWGQGVQPVRDHSSPLILIPREGQAWVPIPANRRSFDWVLPGRYFVAPQEYLPGFYISSATLNGQEVLNQEAQFSAGARIKIVYKPASRVRGTVETKTETNVLLIPAAVAAGGPGKVRSAPVNAGVFEIADVPPGDYVIAAFDRTDALLLETATLIHGVVTKATPLRVREGETPFVQLKLSPWP